MIKFGFLAALLFFQVGAFASSTGSTTRNVDINGPVTSGGTNGSNGSEWEGDEDCGGNDAVNFFYTWDDDNLYLAWTGGDAAQQHIVWIDTDPQSPATNGTGSTATFEYGFINATLPFTGNVFLNIQDTYDEYRTNTAGTWSGGTSNTLNQFSSGSHLEVTVPWASIGGKPDHIYILSYLNDLGGGDGDGYAYGGSPSSIPSGDYDGPEGFEIPSSNTWYFAEIIGAQAPNGNQGALLPVDWMFFSMVELSGKVTLKWGVASEQNNSHFNVQRSPNLQAWRTIGQVEGQGTTLLTQEYSFTDHQPLEGMNYYRLEQVDFDGASDYSKLLSVEMRKKTKMGFHPNPVSGEIFVQLPNQQDGIFTLQVFDFQGRLVAVRPVIPGKSTDVSSLQPGNYFMRLFDESGKTLAVEQFMKL